jgi:hypothetical protein
LRTTSAGSLDLLEPVANVLQRLSAEQGLSADIGCGYFTSRWNSSFGFSAETLSRVAELGASLRIDFYADELAPDFKAAFRQEPPPSTPDR